MQNDERDLPCCQQRRQLLVMLTHGAGLAVTALACIPAGAAEPLPRAVMYKNTGCGCCDVWAEHLRKAGFELEVHEAPAIDDVKERLGVPADARSCHTVEIGRYVVEGHVPASDVLKLLAESPRAWGLAVPGMPIGSPGMGELKPGMSFEVLLIGRDGQRRVFSRHQG
jgi:hypothetical protein